MAFTPLIKQLNQQGTTFYTFSSAAKDLSKCLANTSKEFVFSHFVCLDLPDIINVNNYDHTGTPNNSSIVKEDGNYDKNYMQLNAIDNLLFRDYNANPKVPKSSSEEVCELLQDYVYNFEELLISTSDDNSTDRSVAERVFWHWLKEMGAINFKEDTSKVAPELVTANEKRFVEGVDEVLDENDQPIDISNFEYNNVVKYIGNIDITNNVDIANEAYTEVYIHIPSEVGNTPTILFKQEVDGNFDINQPHEVQTYPDFIIGQRSNNPTYPIDVRALYDDKDAHQYVLSENTDVQTKVYRKEYLHGLWNAYCYKTDIDGLCIDFDANSYREIVLGGEVDSIDKFNKSSNATNFQFNTVLLYYDIVDTASNTRTSNLYGILFLDDCKHDSWDYFQRYPKYKPITGVQNGNSYGFKVNLRIDIEPNKQGITTLVNEYNTYSMTLFADALSRVQNCVDTFTRLRGNLSDLEERMDNVEVTLTSLADYNQMRQELTDLSESVENANIAFADRNTILDLIAHNTQNINSIINGQLTTELQYNTDVLQGGYGIELDTNTPNKVIVNSSNVGYALNQILDNNTSIVIDKENPLELYRNNITNNDVCFKLRQGTNMMRLYVDANNPAAYDICIYVDDTLVNWKNGQVLRLVFPDLSQTLLNNKKIIIVTDARNISGYGKYGIMDIIYPTELLGDNPIIELTCVDDTFTSSECFVHDVLR